MSIFKQRFVFVLSLAFALSEGSFYLEAAEGDGIVANSGANIGGPRGLAKSCRGTLDIVAENMGTELISMVERPSLVS